MRQDSGKHGEVFFKREVLLLFGQRRGAIGERNNAEALLVTCTCRRFNAAVRQEAGDHQSLDPARTKDKVEVCAGEGVESALPLDNDVF
jgi:hypothetical protein